MRNDFIYYLAKYELDLSSYDLDLLGWFISNRLGYLHYRDFIHNEMLRSKKIEQVTK